MSFGVILLLTAVGTLLPIALLTLRTAWAAKRWLVTLSLRGARRAARLDTNMSDASMQLVTALLNESDSVVEVRLAGENGSHESPCS